MFFAFEFGPFDKYSPIEQSVSTFIAVQKKLPAENKNIVPDRLNFIQPTRKPFADIDRVLIISESLNCLSTKYLYVRKKLNK